MRAQVEAEKARILSGGGSGATDAGKGETSGGAAAQGGSKRTY